MLLAFVGCLSRQMQIVIEARFSEIRPYFNGLFCVCTREATGDSSWSILNSDGHEASGPFEWCGLFSEGYLRIKNGQAWEYLADDLKPALRIEADWAGDLLCSRIRVIEIGRGLLTRFVNERGETVIPPASGDFGDFSEGLVTRQVDPKTSEIWNSDGELVTRLMADELGVFSEGLCSVSVDGVFGFVGRDGSWAIPPRYDEVSEFSDGLAAARMGSEWFFIDPKGQTAVKGPFAKVEDFIEGYAMVLRGERCAYIDKTGRVIWEEI